MTMHIYPIEPGAAHPVGAVADEYGVNFAIFSEHATSVELLLFARHDDPRPFQTIPLDPIWNRCPIPYRARSNVVEGFVLEEAVSERMGFDALAGGSVVYESKGDRRRFGSGRGVEQMVLRHCDGFVSGFCF
jgi:pullulanase/glycogen debranching enzyme